MVVVEREDTIFALACSDATTACRKNAQSVCDTHTDYYIQGSFLIFLSVTSLKNAMPRFFFLFFFSKYYLERIIDINGP